MVFNDIELLKRLLSPVKIENFSCFKPFDKFSIDSRTIGAGQGFIAIKGKYCDGHDFIPAAAEKGAAFIVATKDLALSMPLPYFIVEDSYKALAQIVRHIREKAGPFVYGITGSVGKTTTKEMLSFLLADKIKVLKSVNTENNFLGVSKTFLSLADEKAVVLELGTNYPGEIAVLGELSSPDAAIITAIKPAHLEGLSSLSGVYKEKTSILHREGKNRIRAALNGDDPWLRRVDFKGEICWFGKSRKNNLYFRLRAHSEKSAVFLIQDKFELTLPLHFSGFISNVLAALAGAGFLGCPLKDCVDKMNTFSAFAPLRMQIQKLGNLVVINDAYNANPYSFIQALKVVKQYSLPKIAVVGDMLELGKRSRYYHRRLAPHIIEAKICYVLALGEWTPELIKELRRLGHRGAYHFSSHKDAAEFIKKSVKKRHLIFLKGSRKMELEKILGYL